MTKLKVLLDFVQRRVFPVSQNSAVSRIVERASLTMVCSEEKFDARTSTATSKDHKEDEVKSSLVEEKLQQLHLDVSKEERRNVDQLLDRFRERTMWKDVARKYLRMGRRLFSIGFQRYAAHLLLCFTVEVTTVLALTGFMIAYDWQSLTFFSLQIFFALNIIGNWIFMQTRTAKVEARHCPDFSSKYCYTCKFFRPLFTHHCSFCDACIWRRDHHCFFFGTCIGGLNLEHFNISLIHIMVYVTSTCYMVFWYLQDRYRFEGLEFRDLLIYPNLYEKVYMTPRNWWVGNVLGMLFGLIVIGSVLGTFMLIDLVGRFWDFENDEQEEWPDTTPELQDIYGKFYYFRFVLPLGFRSEASLDTSKLVPTVMLQFNAKSKQKGN